jgi:hypothetical protein
MNIDWIHVLMKKGHSFDLREKNMIHHCLGYDIDDYIPNYDDVTIDYLKLLTKYSLVHYNCLLLTKIVKKDKFVLPDNFVDYLMQLLLAYRIWPSHYDKRYEKTFDPFFLELGMKFTTESHKYIVKLRSRELLDYCIQKGFAPNQDFANEASKCITFHMTLLEFHKSFNIQITTEMMNSILEIRHIIDNYAHTITRDLRKFKYPEEIVKEVAMTKYDGCKHIDVYTLCTLIGTKPNEKTFEISINLTLKNAFDDCIKILEIKPNKEHLQSILSKNIVDIDMLNTILCYKILPDKQDFEIYAKNCVHKNNSTETVELLIKHGLQLNFDDIKLALQYKIVIKNLERFNIPYDEKLYYWCYVYNIFPYDNDMNIDEHTLKLRKMCRNSIVSEESLIEYMKDSKIMPDRYCFDHACYYNYQLSRFFVDEKITTLGMFYWSGKRMSGSISLPENAFANFIHDHDITQEYMQMKCIINIE